MAGKSKSPTVVTYRTGSGGTAKTGADAKTISALKAVGALLGVRRIRGTGR